LTPNTVSTATGRRLFGPGAFGYLPDNATARPTSDLALNLPSAEIGGSDFLDWVCFGGPVVRSGDPVEQQKQLKYASLVANAVMLSNVADLTDVLSDMGKGGHPVTPALVACLSPYIREHIRRFGRFVLDMTDLPDPLDPQPLPFEIVL
jgi:Tn3 transposase DDE domain